MPQEGRRDFLPPCAGDGRNLFRFGICNHAMAVSRIHASAVVDEPDASREDVCVFDQCTSEACMLSVWRVGCMRFQDDEAFGSSLFVETLGNFV